jgi:hypothetical protein
VHDFIARNTIWNLTDLETAVTMLRDPNEMLVLGNAFTSIRKLDITLRLPLALYKMIDEQVGDSMHRDQESRAQSKTSELCSVSPALVRRDLDLAQGIAFGSSVGHAAGEAELASLEEALGGQRSVLGGLAPAGMWGQVCANLPRLQQLNKLRIWLDHDTTDYWATINERAFISPLISAFKTRQFDISIHLPEINPRLEDSTRHFLDELSNATFKLVRRVRQRHHGYVNRYERLFVTTACDFPVLRVGDFPYEDMKLEELRAEERRMWFSGADMVQELANGGGWVHDGGTDCDSYLELGIEAREEELERSLKWPEVEQYWATLK